MSRRLIKKCTLVAALSKEDCKLDQELLSDDLTICIDSRLIEPNDIFIAIRGDLNDGHNFIDQALKRGAVLVIADEDQRHLQERQLGKSANFIFVPNTLDLFGAIAREHLSSMPAKRIAITGSNGKTTTKEMLKAALLAIFDKAQVHASDGNKNNRFGLPLSALELNTSHKVAVLELGMNQKGEMQKLCSIVNAHVGAITNISEAHAGNFSDGAIGVMNEKAEMFRMLARNQGQAIVNLDDPKVGLLADQLHIIDRSKISFGHSPQADVRILAQEHFCLKAGQQICRLLIDGQIFTLEIPLAGAHQAMNAACVMAIIYALNLPLAKAAAGIKGMTKNPGRMDICTTKQGILVINDAYNANPKSMRAGIITSLQFEATRRIAVIGAMAELGIDSDQEHQSLGQLLAANFDYLFICQQAALAAVKGAKDAGMSEDKIFFANDSSELLAPLKTMLRPGDLLFIKGSLSSNMLPLASALMAK